MLEKIKLLANNCGIDTTNLRTPKQVRVAHAKQRAGDNTMDQHDAQLIEALDRADAAIKESCMRMARSAFKKCGD